MFNLKSDLKIYTCDKHRMIQSIMKHALVSAEHYTFPVNAKIKTVREHQYGNEYRNVEKITFSFEGFTTKDFEEALNQAGIRINDLQAMERFHHWARANPTKSYSDFQAGVSASLSLSKEKLDAGFQKIRPDVLMNTIALAPDSQLAQMIGKVTGGYRRRRRAKDDRETCILRAWALFGVEVALSASSADFEQILAGIALHDFGITHCESLQQVLKFVADKINCSLTEKPAEFAQSIHELDALILTLNGKVPSRTRPRSPLFRQVYDMVYVKTA